IRRGREAIGSDVGADANSNVLGVQSVLPVLLGIAARQPTRAGAATIERLFVTVQWEELTATNAALHRMSVRAVAPDPELAAKVRHVQDLVGRRDSIATRLLQARAAAMAERDENRIKTLQAQSSALDAEIAAASEELRRSFPRYAALALPEPLSVADVRS